MRITIDAAPREQHGECDDDCEMDHRGEEERGLHGASGAQVWRDSGTRGAWWGNRGQRCASPPTLKCRR